MDILTNAVSKILEPMVAPITAPVNRHIGYVFQFRSNVDSLDGKARLLEVERDRLQCSVEAALRRVEDVEKHVLGWKDRADTAIVEARALIRNGEEEAQRGCSLRLATRYRISKKAAKGTQGIAQLLEERDKLGDTIAHPRGLHQIVRPVPVEGYEADSRTKILKEVMDALLDPNITMVGVWGMGGIGKTTLAEEVQRQAKSSFDQVILATVSATPEVERIQDTIAGVFPESKLEDCTDATRSSRLHQILKDRKVLIIMDDLWSSLELDKVGIPSWNDKKGCKILLTSRNEDILSNMGSQKNFRLEFLSEEESMSLFEKKVINFDYPEIAKQILAKCDGFPLLIVTVGGHLKNKGIHVWEDALTQLSRFDDGKVVEKVHSVLESSYDNLDDDVTKQIFLLFGIFSQSNTTMLYLLRYGLGMGFFKDRSVCQARNRFKTLIDDLKACSLLDVDKKGNSKMHDIVRETAIRIARRNKYAFRERDGKVLTEWPSRGDINGCSIVSIPQSSNIRQLPEDLGCPDVELLLLFCNWHSVDIPDSTFEGTTKLKVIHFAMMELASLPIKPSQSLTDLHTLCLEDCHLQNLTTITQLERLEILSLRGSDMEALPSEIGNLTRMKVLDLSDCSKLRFIPVGVISKLTSLEELLMRNSFENWEVEKVTDGSNARLSELKCLVRLESLVIQVPDTRALSEDFFFDRLKRFQVSIGSRLEFNHGSEITRTLKLGVPMSTDLLQKVSVLLGESEILCLNGTMGSTIHLYDLEKKGFPNLKKLRLWCSHDILQVVHCIEQGPTACFPLLESLKLSYLTSIMTICQGRPAPESFSQMKRLKIYGCVKLKNLFPLSAVRNLPQLEVIMVHGCKEMEALFVAESGCGDEENEVVELPLLRRLHLDELPRLKCFLCAKENPIGLGSSENAGGELMPFFSEKVALPSLEALKMRNIPKIDMIWCNQLRSSAFEKLNSLDIGGCGELQRVFSSGSIERFCNLKSLRVVSCPKPEEMYQFGDGIASEDPMILGLNELYLSHLPRLKRIWKEDSTGRFRSLQNLESITISHCESLENVFPPVVAKTLSQLKNIEIWRCAELKEIVAEEKELEISTVDRPCSLLPLLTSLAIVGCPKANIFGGGLPHCPNQQPFFSPEKVVPKLKEMRIDGRIFKSMSSKYLTGLESLGLFSTQGETSVEVSELENIPLLRKLAILDSRVTKLWTSGTIRIVELFDVHWLRHVWRPDSQLDLLEILNLWLCHDLFSLAPSPSASFWRLSTLELVDCYKLTELVHPSTASTMASLVILKISHCLALKEIVAAKEQQDDRTTGKPIVFKKLKTLELRSLKSLRGFCISGSYSFEFPCLEKVSISCCPVMRIFCNGHLITPKLHKVGSLPLWGNDLNTTIKHQYEDGPQHIGDVRLSGLPELVERWGKELPFKLFSRITELVVDQLPLLLPVAVPSDVLPALSGLRKLVVEKCDSVEEIFDLDGMDHQNEDHVNLMSKLSHLKLSELPKLKHVWNEDSLGILGLKNLSHLEVHSCGNLTQIFTLPVALGLVHIERLYVTVCPLVDVIIKQQSDEQPPADWDRRTIFPSLNLMQLENLPSLMEFFSGNDVLRYPKLTSVRVEGCPRMCLLGSTALSTEEDENIIVQRREDRPCDGDVHEPAWGILNKQVEISRLEELTVEWNSSMGNAWHEIVPQSVLHGLTVVKLTGFPAHHELLPSDFVQGTPNLRKFSIADSFCKQIRPRGPRSVSEIQPPVSFKKLTSLELFNLPELDHLFEEDSQSGSLFQHLEKLKVSKCKRLTRLVHSTTAKGLVNLNELAVEECETITEVVSSNGDEVGDEIVFEKLKSLKLHGLPCLASFSSGNCAFIFPRLDEVVVRECPNMRTFAKNAQTTPKLDYIETAGQEEDVDPWRLVEDGINSTIEKLFSEKN